MDWCLLDPRLLNFTSTSNFGYFVKDVSDVTNKNSDIERPHGDSY